MLSLLIDGSHALPIRAISCEALSSGVIVSTSCSSIFTRNTSRLNDFAFHPRWCILTQCSRSGKPTSKTIACFSLWIKVSLTCHDVMCWTKASLVKVRSINELLLFLMNVGVEPLFIKTRSKEAKTSRKASPHLLVIRLPHSKAQALREYRHYGCSCPAFIPK